MSWTLLLESLVLWQKINLKISNVRIESFLSAICLPPSSHNKFSAIIQGFHYCGMGERTPLKVFSFPPPRKIPPSRLTKAFQNSTKGYLRYKTITSQNVPPKAQIKNFFISYKNYVSFLRYSSFCISIHPMIYQISKY